MPIVLKLMLINTSINKSDGPLVIISGSHAFNINNNVFDKIIPYVFFKKKKTFTSSNRECILFDGRILHRRMSSTKNGFRSATIISVES